MINDRKHLNHEVYNKNKVKKGRSFLCLKDDNNQDNIKILETNEDLIKNEDGNKVQLDYINELKSINSSSFIKNEESKSIINHLPQNKKENNTFKIDFKEIKSIMRNSIKEKDKLNPNLLILSQYRADITKQEDTDMTEEYFLKIKYMEICYCVITFTVLCSSYLTKIFNSQIFYLDNQLLDNSHIRYAFYISLYINSSINSISIIMILMKYRLYFLFYKQAKYIFKDESIYDSGLLFYFVIELIISLLNPNILFHDYCFILSKEANLHESTYYINDLLFAITLVRVFFVIQSIVVNSIYYSAQCDRICKMFNLRLNLSFSLKCIFIKYHFYAVLLITLTLSIFCGLLIEVLDGNMIIKYNESILDYIWTVFVIFTTVGYGDFNVKTNMGRFGMIFTAFLGIFLVSIFIMSLQMLIKLSNRQNIAYEFSTRINSKEKLQIDSELYISKTLVYYIKKKRCEKPLFINNGNSYIYNDDHIKRDIKDAKHALVDMLKMKYKLRKELLNYYIKYQGLKDESLINQKLLNLSVKINEIKNKINNININK